MPKAKSVRKETGLSAGGHKKPPSDDGDGNNEEDCMGIVQVRLS